MKIYTRAGDQGTTTIWGGKRLKKYNDQVEAYGTVDELTSMLGLILTYKISKADKDLITTIQRDLHDIMSVLCGAPTDLKKAEGRLSQMESFIDAVEKEKPTPSKFILIQGSSASMSCHIARTVCRRAERRTVKFLDTSKKIDMKTKTIMLQYLNRLSDTLFVMGRKYNKEKEMLI